MAAVTGQKGKLSNKHPDFMGQKARDGSLKTATRRSLKGPEHLRGAGEPSGARRRAPGPAGQTPRRGEPAAGTAPPAPRRAGGHTGRATELREGTRWAGRSRRGLLTAWAPGPSPSPSPGLAPPPPVAMVGRSPSRPGQACPRPSLA